MNNKGYMRIIEFIIFIIIFLLVIFIVLPIASNYGKQKGHEDAINEYKIQQYNNSLLGMNYNNTEGWYKECKIKIFYHTNEEDINNFINEKDVIDIKTTRDQVLIIYTNSLKGNKYEEII